MGKTKDSLVTSFKKKTFWAGNGSSDVQLGNYIQLCFILYVIKWYKFATIDEHEIYLNLS